ncbi:MAG: hypothetical protein HKN23_04025 [Verrucomicrobiales bacterium]|nr:hypothetical protein [Verrucomicrobiales bacterium]
MKFYRFFFALFAVAALGFSSCEQHSFEETQKLHLPHGAHADHADHGDEKDDHKDHKNDADHDGKKSDQKVPAKGEAKDVGI